MSINYKAILKIIGILFLGALGALIFNVFLLPYLLTNPSFENYQFVKDFKQGKIFVNKTEQVYIQESTSVENAIKRVKDSVVTIQSPTLALSSGLIATSDGSIVTLASVIGTSGNVKVFFQGEAVSFKVVTVDYKNNLALVKIDKNNLQTVGFANAGNLSLGQKVFLVAPTSVKQDNWFANEGMVRQINPEAIKTTMVEKSVAGGAPLFNSAGELVGLGFIDKEGNISAIPINKIKNLLGL